MPIRIMSALGMPTADALLATDDSETRSVIQEGLTDLWHSDVRPRFDDSGDSPVEPHVGSFCISIGYMQSLIKRALGSMPSSTLSRILDLPQALYTNLFSNPIHSAP